MDSRVDYTQTERDNTICEGLMEDVHVQLASSLDIAETNKIHSALNLPDNLLDYDYDYEIQPWTLTQLEKDTYTRIWVEQY